MDDIIPRTLTSAIKDWPEDERPRERLLKHGAEGLSDAQLLAILLRTGHQRQNAVGLAMKLITQFGGLLSLSEASVAELARCVALDQPKQPICGLLLN